MGRASLVSGRFARAWGAGVRAPWVPWPMGSLAHGFWPPGFPAPRVLGRTGLGLAWGAKGPGPGRLGIYLLPRYCIFFRLDTAIFFRLDTATIFRLDAAIIFRLYTAIIVRLDTAIIFRLDTAIIFRLDTAITGPCLEGP